METSKVPISQELLDCGAVGRRIALRRMSMGDFIEQYGGTLRKASRQGLDIREYALKKRIQFEFGDGFEFLPRSRVTVGVPKCDGSSMPVTESLWHADRLAVVNFYPEDKYCLKHIEAARPDGSRTEGLALVLLQTSFQYIPSGVLVFAFLTEFDPVKKTWSECRNPF